MNNTNLIRLNYASTATFSPNYQGGIEVQVARILAKSRQNNVKVQVGGVLHYGNGYFFQCLEGDRAAVNAVYNRIGKDERHKDVELLLLEDVTNRLFKNWSMKYLNIDGPINELLKQRNMKFNPYQFDKNLINDLLKLCALGVDPTEASMTTTGNNQKKSWWKRLFS